MKQFIACYCLLFLPYLLYAQKASDVIENGIKIQNDQKLFLQYNAVTKKVMYDLNASNFTNPKELMEDKLYLAKGDVVNIYITPLNPLSYSFSSANTVMVDPIDQAAESALATIISSLSDIAGAYTQTANKKERALLPRSSQAKRDDAKNAHDCALDHQQIIDELQRILTVLKNSKKTELDGIFGQLKNLPFSNKSDTQRDVASIKSQLDIVSVHFAHVDTDINAIEAKIKDYTCEEDAFLYKLAFTNVLKEIRETQKVQVTRLNNVKKIFTMVEEASDKAGDHSAQCEWCCPVDGIKMEMGEMAVFTITVRESGYSLPTGGEISAIEPKVAAEKTIKFRNFHRLVPEISAGNAFTFFNYFTYGTTSDSTGQQYVASTGKDAIYNLNFTAMINFTYYIQKERVHPFWQIGVGANVKIPTLLTGLGMRVHFGKTRLGLSLGYGFAWIKRLDELRVGDKVSGTADIDKDLKYKFVTPKPYVGIQYNF